MRAKRPSLKDIAAQLNISVTAASFVLNGKAKEKGISEALTARVLEHAEKIGYQPNQLARSLRTGKSRVIVFMVEDISNPFFARIARLIEDIAYEKGYRILFCSSENDDRKSVELINLFVERQVDGFIIIPSPGIKGTIKKLIQEKVPVVLFDRYFPDLKTNYVIIDNEDAAYNATKHLLENGFKKIAFITIESQQTQMMDRLKGYRKALEEQGLSEKLFVMPFRNVSSQEKQEKLMEFLCAAPKQDALFFATNYLTQTGLLVMRENFPEMVHKWGIITFDDDDFFRIHSPSVSAIAQPLEQIAKELMEVLLNQLKNTEAEGQKIDQRVLEAEIKIRESSKRNVNSGIDPS